MVWSLIEEHLLSASSISSTLQSDILFLRYALHSGMCCSVTVKDNVVHRSIILNIIIKGQSLNYSHVILQSIQIRQRVYNYPFVWTFLKSLHVLLDFSLIYLWLTQTFGVVGFRRVIGAKEQFW